MPRESSGSTESSPLRVRVLGQLSAERGEVEIDLRGSRPRLLLALLIAASGEPVPFDRLIDALYSGDPPATARKSAQVHISNLRRALGHGVVLTTPNGYRFDPVAASVDALEFEREVRAARDLALTDPARVTAKLAHALQLWRGSPYVDFDGHPALHSEAVRLGELRLRAIEMRISADLQLGRHADVLSELESLTTDNPYREELRALQMLALYRSGRQADALRVFGRTRELLVDELGIEPSERLRELERQILDQSPALVVIDLPGRVVRPLLATDIEDSTTMWEHDPEAMARALAQHDEIVTSAVTGHDGRVFKHTGDGVFAVFASIDEAAAAAVELQGVLRASSWPTSSPLRVRMAIDEGPCEERNGEIFGPAVNRVARVVSAAHGGQLVAPEAVLAGLDVVSRPLGRFDLRGVGRVAIDQITVDGLDDDFPGLDTDRALTTGARAGGTRTIRGYELRDELGAGDFGIVYRAYQASVGREVAIKVIRPELGNRTEFVRLFEAEAQFVAQLEHPHLVSLYDYWRDPDGAYLVMPYLAGGSLAQALEGGTWNPPAMLRLIDQIGVALAYAHRNGVTHRDIKPANILLDHDGNAYLSDFGIASRTVEIGFGEISIVYLPPELEAGGDADARSDIYCLGLLVHEMLTGDRPKLGGSPRPARELRHDLPAELDVVLARATSASPADRFERVEDLLRALRQAFGVDVTRLPEVAGPPPVRNPFKGLRPFAEVDATDFHGREALVEELLDHLRSHGFTAAVGPSGSGKSSVVKAGVLPAVRSGALGHEHGFVITEMFPGTYPFEELEACLLRVAVDRPESLLEDLAGDDRGLLRISKHILPDDDTWLLIVIDQFEELFSLVGDDDVRARFLANLVTVARDERSRVKVIVTMRADFFDRPLRYPAFAEVLDAGLVPVAMPSDENLALAIVQPARAAGFDLEPGLVAAIVRDISGRPGALPLLQYAMTELVERSTARTLTINDYADAGGASGALARRAERIFESLSGGRRAAARDIFLRLVAVGDGTDDTRRRVRRSELAMMAIEPAALRAVIDEYGSYRLLSFDHDPVTRGPTVEVAHEALIREWPRYRAWIDDRREDLVLGRRLETAAREWADGDRDSSFLLRGGRLEQYREWMVATDLRTTQNEREYLAASERLNDEIEQQRVAHQRRDESLRRRSRLLLMSAVATTIMLSLAAVALVSRSRANSERARAEVLADDLSSVFAARRAAAESIAISETDPTRALSLAVAAVKVTENRGEVDADALDALHFALQELGVTFPADDTTPVAVRSSRSGLRGVFLLPVPQLVELAQQHVMPLSADDCEAYFAELGCPDVLLPVPDAVDIAQGVDAYLAFTKPATPLTGTVVTVAGWEDQATAVEMLAAVTNVLGSQGIQVGYERIDVRDTDVPGDGIDIAYAEQPSWIDDAAMSGRLIDLGTVFDIDEMERRVGPANVEFGRAADGSLRAITMNATLRSMVYFDADRFAEHDYAVPTTWDELLALSDRMVTDGLTPWCWATGRIDDFAAFEVEPGGFSLSDWVSTMLLSESGPEAVEAWGAGELAFTSPEVRRAFERLEQLIFTDDYIDVPFEEVAATNWPDPIVAHGTHTISGGDRPSCVMKMAPSYGLVFDFGPELDSFPFPPIDAENRGYLIASAYLAGMTQDRPETRAVLTAMTDDRFFDYWIDKASGYIAPSLSYQWAPPIPDNTPQYGAFERDLRLIGTYQAAARANRIVYTAAYQMPVEVGMGALWEEPNRLFFEGPETLDEVLAALEDQARVAP